MHKDSSMQVFSIVFVHIVHRMCMCPLPVSNLLRLTVVVRQDDLARAL